eukprot:CAMPEP_0185027404 /NCGR_PEP_ID=MMETSP1103-20130426/12420_1 /TAXON_ID=36769 /ORGANISM="Paraphysomonas bandaiensis, Strain Caron Lab Isolate" /LENGTH=307 /DNA_ID=CAMNT_0027561387 /DNA_START=8 /DNA_END=931 /DNA_ORIENTATION=-
MSLFGIMSSRRSLSRVGSLFRRTCTTNESLAASVPPNLELADTAVLEPPKESPVTPIEFLFPPKFQETSIPVKSFKNPDLNTSESVTLDPRVFGVAIRQDIIHQIVRYQRAKLRQPQCTKRVGDIRGSTRKIRQQKGSGRARVGQNRAAGRRGGAKAHGPVLRDFSFSLNRKMRALGMMVALASKYREGNLFVVDKLELESHRTKDLTSLLDSHGLLGSLALFVDDEVEKNLAVASRNIQHVKTIEQKNANVYDIVRREKFVITSSALMALQERLISQRYHLGKRKAILNNMSEFERLRDIGASLEE